MSIHVNYGHSKREAAPEDECLFCGKHAEQMAYTYFGAPVCDVCWDSTWRKPSKRVLCYMEDGIVRRESV